MSTLIERMTSGGRKEPVGRLEISPTVVLRRGSAIPK